MRAEGSHIGLLLVRHERRLASPIIPEMIERLRARGASVSVIYPDEQPIDLNRLGVAQDLYVLKSGTEAALSLAGALHAAGAEIVNSYPSSVATRDKVVASQVLAAAGVPTPATYLVARTHLVEPLLDVGPLVVKPHRGSQGRGIHILSSRSDLRAIDGEEGPLLVQRYHQPDGPDCKMYRIGPDVFCVRRRWPARTLEEKLGTLGPVTEELRDITIAAGDAFGLGLYGLDVVYSSGVPYVVDFSSFPGFKGVPQAAERLARFIFDYRLRASPRRRLGEPRAV